MIIIKSVREIGNNRHVSYNICNSVEESGSDSPDVIISLNTLELAVIVLRYMRGDTLNELDQNIAKEALRKAERTD